MLTEEFMRYPYRLWQVDVQKQELEPVGGALNSDDLVDYAEANLDNRWLIVTQDGPYLIDTANNFDNESLLLTAKMRIMHFEEAYFKAQKG